MDTLLLTTKLHIPPAPQAIVDRPRLVKRLTAGLNGKLTLVSAPAGYGKTTLVSAWVNSLQLPVGWYSIDNGDNDLSQFLAYLASAIQTQYPHTGESLLIGLQSPQIPPVENLLTTLINDVHKIDQPFIRNFLRQCF